MAKSGVLTEVGVSVLLVFWLKLNISIATLVRCGGGGSLPTSKAVFFCTVNVEPLLQLPRGSGRHIKLENWGVDSWFRRALKGKESGKIG